MKCKEKKSFDEDKNPKRVKEEISLVNFETDDPFEIFFDNYKENVEEILQPEDNNENVELLETKEPKSSKSKLTDNDFMNILKFTKIEKPLKKCNVFGISQQIKILSNSELDDFKMTLYKFPFEMNLKFDNSEIIKKIFLIFVSSLKDAFQKYKEEKKEFFVKFNCDFLHFGSELKTTKGLKKILLANEINFTEEDEFIHIPFNEICLVVDLILNINLTVTSTIPFVLSKYPFENSMVYSVNMKKIRTIKQEGEIYISYILNGPIWLEFCDDLLEHNNKIVW
jgi:hypothetical protein